ALSKGAAERFAINRHHLAVRYFCHRLHPVQKAPLQGLRLQDPQHAIERVVRRNPTRELQELPEPGFSLLPKIFNGRITLRSTQDRAHGNDYDVAELMPAMAPDPRTGQAAKMAH